MATHKDRVLRTEVRPPLQLTNKDVQKVKNPYLVNVDKELSCITKVDLE